MWYLNKETFDSGTTSLQSGYDLSTTMVLKKINDVHSSDMMIAFYEDYATSQSYTDALRAAKLQLLSQPETALPRYWGAFVLVGE